MSELLVNTIKKADGTGSLTVPAESGTVVTTASPSLGRRNLIINGAMQVAQRGTSSTAGGYATVDRFRTDGVALDDLNTTKEQSSDAPSGFSNSLKLTVNTPESSIAADERYEIRYLPEGQDLQHLAYGTADAKTVTVSFWVKSSVTGTYSWQMYQQDHPDRRTYSTSYTINSANTWEYKTMTIPGDTSGQINNDTGNGFIIAWQLSAGSTYTGGTAEVWSPYVSDTTVWAADHAVDWAGTSGATFYITGVQLEVGSVATPFEHRSYGEELALCQRYYQSIDYYYDSGSSGTSTNVFYYTPFIFPVPMRANPSMTASAWGDNTGNAQTRYTSTVVNGWIMQDVIPTACIMRGNHGNIYNYMKGRGKFDAEL